MWVEETVGLHLQDLGCTLHVLDDRVGDRADQEMHEASDIGAMGWWVGTTFFHTITVKEDDILVRTLHFTLELNYCFRYLDRVGGERCKQKSHAASLDRVGEDSYTWTHHPLL